jgi:two-component system cell cycle sensor histidine kinase/response regulator CckA
MVISCTATRALLEAFDSKGLDVAALVAGSGHTESFLRNPKNRVDWDTFAALNDRAAELCGTDVALFDLGEAMGLVPGYAFARALTGCMLTPRQFYRAVQRWVGPAQFPNIHADLIERDDGKLVLTLELPPGDRPSRAFFEICAGALGQVPTWLAHDPAPVKLTTDGRRAEFVIELPRTTSVRTRLAALSRMIFGGPEAMRALALQQEALKESYEALLRTRQDFRQVIESMSDAVLIHRGGTVLWANAALLEPFGYDRFEEIAGRAVLDFVHPEDVALVRARLGGPIDPRARPVDCRLLSRDGSVKTLEIAPTQEILFDGAPARLVVGRDRTERRHFQQQMMHADRMATIGVLAAGVAHEINNPLTYVAANVQLARDAAQSLGASGRPIVDALGTAGEGVERVTSIVRDLKMLSRGDTPAVDRSDIVAVDVRALVESTLALAQKQLERKARVFVDASGPIIARASRARLGQVMLNLLLNAAEAMPEGAADHNEIRVRLEARGTKVSIAVHDTGPGIPTAIVDRIFDPFFTTKPAGQGTGLGLAICQRIVTDLGGSITAESTPGKGATFEVTLPAAPYEEVPSSSRRSPVSSSSRRARLLVVDDEPLLRNVLRTVLEESHDVVLAGEGKQALELLLGDDHFDVVLCDLMMADVNGMDVYETVRAKRPGLEKRIVFMTGGAFTTRGRQFLASVPNQCLEKPFDAGEVFTVVNEHLARNGKTP